MIQNINELEVCKRRLTKLQNRIEQIVTHPQKSRRAKDMELAGMRGMIEQLQREIQSYELSQIQQTILSAAKPQPNETKFRVSHPLRGYPEFRVPPNSKLETRNLKLK